jgi:hypothetical protein
VAKAAAAAARALRREATRLWDGTANPDGPGFLMRGQVFEPIFREDLDPRVVDAVVRLARLAGEVAETLRDCPGPIVRRSAAVLAARAHPIRVAFDV